MPKRQAERGQTLVEFALVAAFIMSLVFGIIDFGEAFYAYNVVTNAARVGSRWAMVRGNTCTVSGCPATPASIRAYVMSKSPGLDPSPLVTTVTPFYSGSCNDVTQQSPGCVVKVTVQTKFNFIYRFKAPVTLTSSSQMVISQ